MVSWRTLISYGFGHAFNDLCATMWFTYFIIYFQYVLGFSSVIAGTGLLVGQLADAAAGMVIGLLSDRPCCKLFRYYGQRKSWHLLGTILVTMSFPFIFVENVVESNLTTTPLIIYYAIFIVLFQIGWCSVQISHLSLAPDLSKCGEDRTSLTTIRYATTILSNIFVFLLMWILFKRENAKAQVGRDDRNKFTLSAVVIVTIGIILSIVFHIGTQEETRKSTNKKNVEDQKSATSSGNRLLLLKDRKIYHTMSIYLVTQVFVNVSLVLIPLYLQTYLQMEAERLAIQPLIMYIASFIVTTVIKRLNDNRGRRQTFAIGAPFALVACVGIYFGRGDMYETYFIYIVVVLFGIASSIMSVTSLAILSDVVYVDMENGAFIYSIMTFFDKVSSGVVVMIVQYLRSSIFN